MEEDKIEIPEDDGTFDLPEEEEPTDEDLEDIESDVD
jgi:hypothetical protein